MEQISFLGVGFDVRGWCGARPDLGDRPFFIALSGDGQPHDLLNTALHEIAHGWLMTEPVPDQVAGGAYWHRTVFDTPLEVLRPKEDAEFLAIAKEKRRDLARNERIAEALTIEWCNALKNK